MIEDGRSVPSGAILEADVCVVGAGAAGITLARRLASSSLRVVVLESGGYDLDPDIQSLYAGDADAPSPYYLDGSRLRYFGGSTNHWAGFCRPLDSTDFEARPWVPARGWPIDPASLVGYYRAAQADCEIGPFDYDGESWVRRIGRDAFHTLPLGDHFSTSIIQYSPPTLFGKRYGGELERASNIRVLLYSNAVNVDAEDRLVTGVDVQAWRASQFRVEARATVLACGGVENARLLLASNAKRPRGVGNERDLVGRYFADHPILETGEIALRDGLSLELYAGWRAGETAGQGVVVLTPSAMAKGGLLNGGFFLFPHFTDEQSDAFQALLEIARKTRAGETPEDLGSRLATILRDLDDVVGPAVRRLLRRGRRVSSLQLRLFSEQAPNPDSRVTLDTARDALGMPRAKLDWRLSEIDRRSFEESFALLGRAFGAAQLGRIRYDLAEARTAGGFHHMGTTRMSDDPAQGVVDANCRVHGLGNLYVAGSSVFPTTGCSNPTLTIVALARRLADHLAADLAILR